MNQPACRDVNQPARRISRLAVGLALLAVFPVAWVAHAAVHEPGPSVCVFKLATGFDCAFCGLTRAFASATHGAWSDAFACNPAWPLAALAVATLATCSLVDAAVGTDRLGALLRPARRRLWWVLAIVVGLTVARILATG